MHARYPGWDDIEPSPLGLLGIRNRAGVCSACNAALPSQCVCYVDSQGSGTLCLACRDARDNPMASEPLDTCPDCGRVAEGGELGCRERLCGGCFLIRRGLEVESNVTLEADSLG